MGQAERGFSAASTFLSGLLAISASQFIGAPLKLVDPKFYDSYMAWTKESFAVLVTTITQWWAPTAVRVSGDESMAGQLYQMDDGTLKCNFPHRLVLMANHQLYTDWLYLWWIAYTNKMHGRIYIILKESLKNVPIFGWGAQFYNFIFLSRKWETDKFRFRNALNHLKDPNDPMWLLIFPEGTNLSEVTREKSAKWAEKSGIPDMKNQLLPRTTGLQFCLQELQQTTNWLYDCTIAYEGVPKGMYGQDVFTLRSSLFEGRPPKSVNMYWRRYKISEIPLDNDDAFGRWLMNRWREKDYILEYFYKFNQFPAEDPVKALAAASGKRKPQHAKMIHTELKGGGWDEFLSIFGPITTAAGALSSVDMTEPLNFDALLGQVAQQQQLNLLSMGKAPIAAASQQYVRNALQAAQKSHPLPPAVLNYLMKATPQTQDEMKQTIVSSAQKSGNPEIARRAAQASTEKKAVSTQTQQGVAKVAEQTSHAISQATGVKRDTLANPRSKVQNTMPLANMSSMVTRPLSTMAFQTAAATVRNAAAQRTQEKGAALPGQAAAPRKTMSGANAAKGAPAAPSAAQKPANKPSMGNGASKQGVVKPAATKGRAPGSKALGTQKYVNGVKA